MGLSEESKESKDSPMEPRDSPVEPQDPPKEPEEPPKEPKDLLSSMYPATLREGRRQRTRRLGLKRLSEEESV